MRIGINTLFLVPGDVGGTEVYLRNTLSAMAASMDGRDTLLLFTNRENDASLRRDFGDYPCVEFHQLACRAAVRPFRILAEQFFLPFAAQKQHIDVLWSPGYTAPALCFSPQAVTICDLQYKSYPEDLSLIGRKTLDVLVRTACRRCQAVITISEFSRQEVIKYGFAPEDRVRAIPLGVVTTFSSSAPHLVPVNASIQVLRKLGIEKPFLLCVAHTYPHKNVDKLIEAFSILEKDIPHQLVLVGKARRGEAAVIDSLRRISDSERIARLHGLTELQLQTLYQEADVFILPSSYEGFGLPVIEAMMAGLPVIAPKKASLPEVGGAHAFYVANPAPQLLVEQILHVLKLTEEQRDKHVRDAREWAKGFTWERTAEQTLQVLKSIAEKNL